MQNLKRLCISIRSPFHNFLGSPKIERFEFSQFNGEPIKWNYFEAFPRLSFLKTCTIFKPDDLFYHFISLDRLEYLLIEYCIFDKKQEERFFKCISSLKKLKVLSVPITWTKGVILSDSIEFLILGLEDFARSYNTHGPEKGFSPSNAF